MGTEPGGVQSGPGLVRVLCAVCRLLRRASAWQPPAPSLRLRPALLRPDGHRDMARVGLSSHEPQTRFSCIRHDTTAALASSIAPLYSSSPLCMH